MFSGGSKGNIGKKSVKKGNTCDKGHYLQKDADSKLASSLKMNSSVIFSLIFSLVYEYNKSVAPKLTICNSYPIQHFLV